MNKHHNKFFAPILILALVLYTVLIMVVIAHAEPSIALKKGYVNYDIHRDSKYEGNNVFDSEFSDGRFLRYDFDKFFLRLDYDTVTTGNTFSQPIGIAYEQCELTSENLTLSIGKRLEKMYGYVGISYIMNDLKIEQYTPYQFSYGVDDSLGLALGAGVEQPIGNWFLFIEARYIKAEARVHIENRSIDENISNRSLWTGFGKKF